MAYTFKHPSLQPLGTPAADDLSGTGVHTFSVIVQSQCEIVRLMATVSTVMSGAATIAFKKRPIPGSASGEVTIGSIIIPTLTAVGKCVYKDVSPVVLEPGCQVVFEVTSAATSGGAVYGFEANEDPEYVGNQSAMVASA